MSSSTMLKKYYYPYIQINGNIISYGNSLIQAKNISMITIERIPPNKNWIGAIIPLVFSMFVFMIGNKQYIQYGIFAFIIAAVWIIAVAIGEKNKGENLVINLNSGVSLYFYCKNRQFLDTVVSVFISCINQDNNQRKTDPITIRFDRCEITGGSFFNNSNINSNWGGTSYD